MKPILLRITGGRFKGRRIKAPALPGLRPTREKVRQALFDILREKIEGGSFLELFCGSGAVGIEAISRGAARVVFVDTDRRCIKCVKDNIRALGVAQGVDFVNLSASAGLKSLQGAAKFDIVFIDPPYYTLPDKNCLLKIIDYDILTPNAWCILEHAKEKQPLAIEGLTFFRSYKYGDTVLTLYRRERER